MLPKDIRVQCLLVLLLGSLCLSKATKINLRSAIRDKQEEIGNIVENVSELLDETECTLDQPMILGLESMEVSLMDCRNDDGDPEDCLNDVIFHVKNMPNFENLFCNVTETCQRIANETLHTLWIFQDDFLSTVGACNESIALSEENPLNISCSECRSSDLFWQGLIIWTDNLDLMLNSLESDEFATLQRTCNKEHARTRKAAAKKQREEKRLKQQERKRKQADRKRKQKLQKRQKERQRLEREEAKKNPKSPKGKKKQI
ncbi:hypothetical protein HOLleu_34050 [Holothuria leucospilota]|uniref:Uncharacterized protein n=1 Tax=Holothuria leucospilota TaxID=206669 RepID=A0A9Q1BFY5_HOLLE|nr:hypothetical protein HOLleu_34050 [Holothuria leucospilota]